MKKLLIVLILFVSAPQATMITVTGADETIADDGFCSISEAINSANNDTSSGSTPGECPAGSGADIIELTSNISLTFENHNDATFGRTGTPAINSEIEIKGMSHEIARQSGLTCNNDNVSDVGEFRLFLIIANGFLKLNNVTLTNGCVDNTDFSNSYYGGAVYNKGSLSITNSIIISNKANSGGGVYNANQGVISSVINSSFESNSTVDSGGGIFNEGNIYSISNCNFSENSSYYGGGLENFQNIGSIKNSTFTENSAVYGGGIDNADSINEIINSTFSANLANTGGGLSNTGTNINFIINSTFYGNEATTNGGGIHNQSSNLNNLNHSLFANNLATANADCYLQSGIVIGNNNISNQDNGTCSSAIDQTDMTLSTIDILSDNGCFETLPGGSCVQTHALLTGSEAIDAGNSTSTNHDQRNFSANGVRDIGAYEYQGINDLIYKNGFN